MKASCRVCAQAMTTASFRVRGELLGIVPLALLLASLLPGCVDKEEDKAFVTTGAPSPAPSPPAGLPLPPSQLPPPGPYSESWPRNRNADAVFLMQATFGPTRGSLAAVASGTYLQWVRDQLSEGASLHREYYRARVNPRGTARGTAGTASVAPRTACESGSRWHRFAINAGDVGLSLEVTLTGDLLINGQLRTEIDPSYSGNGFPAPAVCTDAPDAVITRRGQTCDKMTGLQWRCLSTSWRTNRFCRKSCFDFGFGYRGDDCSVGWPALRSAGFKGYVCRAREVLGAVVLLSSSASCKTYQTMRNPGVWFSQAGRSTVTALRFDSLRPGVLLLAASKDGCGLADFIRVGGKDYVFNPRLELVENTLTAPKTSGSECPTVRMNAINAKDCRFVTSSCLKAEGEGRMKLDATTFAKVVVAANKYLLTIVGLRISTSPCGVQSRWKKLSCNSEDCTETNLASTDSSLIADALEDEEGWLRDINVKCDASSVPHNAVVKAGADVFAHVHLNEHDVYDFSTWVNLHPGGRQAIKKWATGNFRLSYPQSHSMTRWEKGLAPSKLRYLGKEGDEVDYQDLPGDLRTPLLAGIFSYGGEAGYQACGSAGEVASDPSLGNQHSFFSFFKDGRNYDNDVDFDSPHASLKALSRFAQFSLAKSTVWTMRALHAKDQLRQRAAWALSQILVVGLPGFGQTADQNEFWMNFYDILVRHSLGNFRDLLREVTYSPVMGEYLTFEGSSSYDHNKKWPDENYAREIMQLFTIGLFKLNPDGTKVLDSKGNAIPTYDNGHITAFARVFTGFERQKWRSNIEMNKGYKNFIDPMSLQARKHDRYPKPDLSGNYLGDGYLLCSDLVKGFLSKGARYEFVGFSYDSKTFLSLEATSELYKALCWPPGGPRPAGGGCGFQLAVELPARLACSAGECDIERLGVVKVAGGFYEFVPPTCVHLFFYNGQVTARSKSIGSTNFQRCEHPDVAVASALCCVGCQDSAPNNMKKNNEKCEDLSASVAERRCTSEGFKKRKFCRRTCFLGGHGYPGDECSKAYEERSSCLQPVERVSFRAAEARCTALGMNVCATQVSQATLNACSHGTGDYAWLPEKCTLKIEIDEQGDVSLESNPNKIKVYWTDGYPTIPACAQGCEVSAGSCVCPLSVELKPVFDRVPTAAELRQRLRVGAYPPPFACTGACASDVKIYSLTGAFDLTTVFEIEGRFFRNVESIVKVANFAFRNPPAFLAPTLSTSASVRAASAEVESLLDHLFHHPNTPPFLARKLIQRFVTSNPSPAYVREVAEAFRRGTFADVGAGAYGDLAATIAAIILHSEARSANAAAMPTFGLLREPLVKLMHFLRAMEFAEDVSGALHSVGGKRETVLKDLSVLIGQFPYMSPSVFNFYSADYEPAGFQSGLFGPEFEIFTAPLTMNFLNGIVELVNSGLSSCRDGFGLPSISCEYPHGNLTLPESGTPSETVAELDTLLTGGRLGSRLASVALEAHQAAPAGQKPAAAQKVVMMSAPFATLGEPQPTGKIRAPAAEDASSGQSAPYKAMVLLFLDGGMDSFNMIVPFKCPLYDEYVASRQDVALVPGQLQEVKTAGQKCGKFGIHYKLPFVKELYAGGDAAFVSNIGALVEPLTKANFKKGRVSRCVGLFSHSDQKYAASTMQCQVAGASPKGVGGRLADALAAAKLRTTSFSVSGSSVWATGRRQPVEIVDKKQGAVTFNEYEKLRSVIGNVTGEQYGNMFSEEYAAQLSAAFASSEHLAAALAAAALATEYGTPAEALGMQLKQVARLIATRTVRKAERDIFVVRLGGFDTHNDALETLAGKLEVIDSALRPFVTELKAQGIFDSTVIFTQSDFGRTLQSNGRGTDHAWAGNHLVIGGNVKGGRVFNDFPASLLPGSEQDAGRGRLIPRFPWESMLVPIFNWMGMPQGEKLSVFPNMGNFNSSHIISTLFA